VVLYNREIRNKLSPGFTVYAFIQVDGGPHGMTVTVGTGGTYKMDPAAGAAPFKQFFASRISAVIL